jgi:DNA polymerase-3 subunit epsilon
MNLKLSKPIAFFDIESTGLDVSKDRIIEIAILTVYPDGKEDMKVYITNPGIPISAENTTFHGFTDETVKDKPFFKEVAVEIAKGLEKCDFSGYNCLRFDVPILMEEFLRAGVDFNLDKVNIVDVQNIFHQMEKRTLAAAYKFYCGEELINAHSAEADIRATYEVFKAQLIKYDGIEYVDNNGRITKPIVNNMKVLAEFTNVRNFVDFAGRIAWKDDVEVFNFGKHKGKPVTEVFEKESSYYDWMMKGDFPEFTKRKITEIRLKAMQNHH